MTSISTGLHVVRKRVKSGERFYVYAYRGGPCIHVQDGTKPAITPELLERAFGERRKARPKNTINSVLDLYRESPAFTNKSAATQDDYRTWLDRISSRFGRVPLRLVADLRPKIIEWQDELSDTPRAADRAVGMLSTVLGWAWDRGLVTSNPAMGIKKIYRGNRADKIWELQHWLAVRPLPHHLTRAIGLAGMTGLALTDLVGLQWESVGQTAIETRRQKTGGSVTVPLYPALRAFLGERGAGPVLMSSRGEPWTVSGFKSSWQKAKPKHFDRTFHDLRGTFATMLAMKGFTDQEIAAMVGWNPERVAAIRSKYIDRQRIIRDIAARMG